MYTKNAELKAGIVILAALVVLLTLLWFAGGAQSLFATTRVYQVRFEQGAPAPKGGDAVQMNGIDVGRVLEVWQKEEIRRGAQLTAQDRASLRLKAGEDGVARELYVVASIRMPKEQKIPDGTTGEITVDVTGARSLKLVPGRSTRDLTEADTRNAPIPVKEAGSLTAVARAVQDLVQKVGTLVDHGNLVLDDVQGAIGSVRKQIDRLDLGKIQENVAAGSEDLRKVLEIARTRVDEIAQKLSDAAGNVQTLTADGSRLVKAASSDVDAILASLKSVSSELQGIVARASPKVDAILDDVGRAAKSGAALGKDLEAIGPRLGTILGDAGTGFGRVLDRLAVVGHNLADASEDLRAHPWKLLNKPDEKEIAWENLRDATSNYVKATRRVQETTEDLKALEARTDLAPEEQKRLVSEALARFQADLAKYEETSQYLLRLLQSGGAGAPAGRPH